MPEQIPFEEFKKIYSRVPRLCIDVVIKNHEGVVLSKRNIEPGKGFWHLPGGTLLLGETIKEAAKRIALNETSLSIKIIDQIGIMEFPQLNNPFRHAVSIAFLAEPTDGKLSGSVQGEEIDFFSELPEPMIEEHRVFLENYLEKT